MGLSAAALAHRKAQAKEYYVRNKERMNAQARLNYLKNREKRLQQAREWQRKNKDRIREHRRNNPQKYLRKDYAWRKKNKAKVALYAERARIKKKFGLTWEQYQSLILAQDNKCEICLKPPFGKRSKAKLHLDHCHTTGKRRGLICGQCNTALGMVNDSRDILLRMISYLDRHAA